jgi:hypothetical protein
LLMLLSYWTADGDALVALARLIAASWKRAKTIHFVVSVQPVQVRDVRLDREKGRIFLFASNLSNLSNQNQR